jgi:hypothetical protein
VLSRLLLRTPTPPALAAASATLAAYPDSLLQRLADARIRILLLERGETVAQASSAFPVLAHRRWHGGRVGLDDCAGLTASTAWGVLVIAPAHRPPVLRHELGHALGALLSSAQKYRLQRLYDDACRQQRFLVPLAGQGIGEYVACGFAALARLEARPTLENLDPQLAGLLHEVWRGDPWPAAHILTALGSLVSWLSRQLREYKTIAALPQNAAMAASVAD